VRVNVRIAVAYLFASDGQRPAANRVLEEARVELQNKPYAALKLDVRLAAADVEKRSGGQPDRAQLLDLEKDAETQGYILVARKAKQLLAAPPPKSG